jgi:hypothetical protein
MVFGLTFELAGWGLALSILDPSQFSRKVQGRSNDLGPFSKLIIGDNHMSASSDCGNVQDEKLPSRVGREWTGNCMGRTDVQNCTSVPLGD